MSEIQFVVLMFTIHILPSIPRRVREVLAVLYFIAANVYFIREILKW